MKVMFYKVIFYVFGKSLKFFWQNKTMKVLIRSKTKTRLIDYWKISFEIIEACFTTMFEGFRHERLLLTLLSLSYPVFSEKANIWIKNKY